MIKPDYGKMLSLYPWLRDVCSVCISPLQTKNTGNLPVHSQNVRVYREVTGISRVYGWVTGFFLHYLSCSFVYHAKFWHKKASECTGGIPVVHDWNILNHESLHQRYYFGPSPEGSTRWGIFLSIQQIRCSRTCPQYLVTAVNRIIMLTIKPSLLHTTY